MFLAKILNKIFVKKRLLTDVFRSCFDAFIFLCTHGLLSIKNHPKKLIIFVHRLCFSFHSSLRVCFSLFLSLIQVVFICEAGVYLSIPLDLGNTSYWLAWTNKLKTQLAVLFPSALLHWETISNFNNFLELGELRAPLVSGLKDFLQGV